jgi:hypothetical protein
LGDRLGHQILEPGGFPIEHMLGVLSPVEADDGLDAAQDAAPDGAQKEDQ